MRGGKVLAMVAGVLVTCGIARGQDIAPQPVQIAPGLASLQGTDKGSGVEYLRLLLNAENRGAQAQPAPVFIVECTQSRGRRSLFLYADFGGIEDIAFTPPFVPTRDDPFPPVNPSVTLEMTFEGYIHSKPFRRVWEQVPNGRYKYRNPGMGSSNMESPRFFLAYLNSLPTLHLVSARPLPGKPRELFFNTAPLLQIVRSHPLCQP
jgi:hypothetical protein